MRRSLTAAAFVLGLGIPAAGHAAPKCEAPAETFDAGAKFAGDVHHVIDGQTLCIGRARNPDTWLRVELSDLEARQSRGWRARAALRRVALGRYAVCTVSGEASPEADAVPAVCRVAGVSIGGRVKNAK